MKTLLPLVLLILIVFAIGCRKEDQITTDPTDRLSFSVDTMIFDTVFTTIGSTTHILKVYNRNNETVRISDISIEGGQASNFRINVDGDSGVSFADVEIAPEDSIFIFVEVTVDINNTTGPMVIEDHLNFLLNGVTQDVLLVAWGQDAIFHYPQNYINGLPPFSCLDGDCFEGNPLGVSEIWTNEKPHVIYGYLVIDSLDHLTIEAGTQVHFHAGSGMWVWRDGQLTVNGTVDQKVVFQGDRLEYMYDDVPGQWDLIRINQGQAGDDNVFEHAIIKNSIIGIQATPLVLNANQANNPVTSENRLVLKNVIIQDNSDIGLWARNYQIVTENSVFANAGRFTALLQGGGSYDINNCTFANYWSETTRNDPGFYISNLYPSEANPNDIIGRSLPPNSDVPVSSIRNCIMYGNDFEEFGYDFNTDGILTVNINFANNLYKVKTTDGVNVNSVYFNNSFVNDDPLFESTSSRDFHLTTGSGALDLANSDATQFDIEGLPRVMPDLGAYELE